MLTDESAIVVQTKQIGQVLKRYAEAANNSSAGAELIAASKELGQLCKPLSSLLAKLPPSSSNRDAADRLSNITRALNTLPTQIRILSNVQASSGYKHGHERLLSLVESLSTSLMDVIPAVNASILSE